MKKWFLIKYEVDTGWDYIKDIALIEAENKIEAQCYLQTYISKLGNEYIVNEIFENEEFVGHIFTGKYGTL